MAYSAQGSWFESRGPHTTRDLGLVSCAGQAQLDERAHAIQSQEFSTSSKRSAGLAIERHEAIPVRRGRTSPRLLSAHDAKSRIESRRSSVSRADHVTNDLASQVACEPGKSAMNTCIHRMLVTGPQGRGPVILLSLFHEQDRWMGAWVHRLSEIDDVSMTASCAKCGPVSVVRAGSQLKCIVARRRQRRSRKPSETAKARRRAHDQRKNRPWRAMVEQTCRRCGFVPEHPCQLDVDHIDGSKANSDPSNLQTLCANCHRLKSVVERRPDIHHLFDLASLGLAPVAIGAGVSSPAPLRSQARKEQRM